MRRNLLIAVTDQGLVSAATFATGILVARTLGVETFGVYVLANGLFLFLASLQQAFVITPMSVYAAAKKEGTAKYIYSTHKLQLLIALIISSALLVASYLGVIKNLSPLAQEAFIWMAPVAFFQLSYDFWRQLLLSRQRFSLLFTIDATSKTALLTCLTILTFFYSETATLKQIYTILALSAVLGSLLAWIKARQLMVKHSEIATDWKRNIDFGKWAASNLLILMGNGQIPAYSAAIMLGAAATGIIGAAVQILGIFQVFLNGIVNYYLPVSVNAYQSGGLVSLKKHIIQATTLMTVLVTIITVPAIYFADTIISGIYGNEYLEQGVTTYIIYLSVAFILGLQRALDIMVRVLEKMKLRSNISLAEMIFLIIFMYPASKFAGLAGIATVAVGGRVLSTLLLFVLVWNNKVKQ